MRVVLPMGCHPTVGSRRQSIRTRVSTPKRRLQRVIIVIPEFYEPFFVTKLIFCSVSAIYFCV
jgi:hypothetical protein